MLSKKQTEKYPFLHFLYNKTSYKFKHQLHIYRKYWFSFIALPKKLILWPNPLGIWTGFQIWLCLCLLLVSLALSAAAPNPAFYLVETQESHTWFNMHCNENPIHVFLFWQLRAASVPIFPHSSVCVSDLYIPWIGPQISCSRRGRSMVGGNI